MEYSACRFPMRAVHTRHDPWLGGQQWLDVGRRQRRKQRRRRSAGNGSFSLTPLPDLRPHVSEIASYGPVRVMERSAHLRSHRGAPVRMTIEGVGETRSLADALSLLCFHVRSNALNIFPLLFGSGLETLVAVAPEFWPGRSFLDLVGSFRFLPLGGTFFLPLARGDLLGARLLFCFGILVGRSCCLLLRGGGRNELRHRCNDKSDRKRGGKHGFRHGCHFPLFPTGRCRSAIGRSPQPAPHDNPHRL